MFLNVIDVIVILFLLAGCVIGFKKGAIQSFAYLIGTILVIWLSWILKDYLASFMYNHLPFFKLGGIFKGIQAVNILIYKGIAFFIILTILSSILGIVLKITGVISKIVDYSIILTLPSKIIGIVIGFVEAYISIFIILFVFSQFSFSHEYLKDSKYATFIIENTPKASGFNNSYVAFDKISDISKKDNSINEKNYNAFDILLKYHIISSKDLNKLIYCGKIDIEGIEKLIERYGEK